MARRSRQEIYPDTATFHFHNANPKKRITADCVLRAISTALDEDYNTILLEMVQIQLETGYHFTSVQGIERYLASKGWVKQKQPRKEDNTKYTGKEFCKHYINKKRRYLANIGGHHIVAIVNGKVYDIWDSTDGCIGNYWVKGE